MSILIFPLFIFIYFTARFLRATAAKVSLPLFVKYFLVGIFFSLLTEAFVFHDHLSLFSQALPADLFLSIGIYGSMILIWYGLLRHYEFSLLEIFALAGLWGIVFEQNFKILLSLNPIAYLYIFLVYGSLAGIPFTIFREEFPKRPSDGNLRKYVIALFFQCFAYPAGFIWIAFFRLVFHIT